MPTNPGDEPAAQAHALLELTQNGLVWQDNLIKLVLGADVLVQNGEVA